MNPENVGENIALRHSLLWRKPLKYEKEVQPSEVCHLQLNQLATTGLFWKVRNLDAKEGKNKVRPASSGKNRKESDGVDVRQFQLQNDVTFMKGKKLVESMRSQKKEKLVESCNLTIAAYPAVGKLNFVINDYHPKVANPNYSRNIKGKHFTS